MKTEVTTIPLKTLDELSDTDLLRYLICEGVKTKTEIANEIRERFYTFNDFTTFLDKAKNMWD